MSALTCTSDSLIGSLCREAERIGQRCSQLSATLQTCRNLELSLRLRLEVQQLQQRNQVLLTLARSWRSGRNHRDLLTLDLLIELCRRTLARP
jgi:hypothetical protein